MPELSRHDLLFCVRRLPGPVRDLLKARPNELMVAGGYVRACVAGETISDIDIMSPTKDCAAACSMALSKACGDAKIWESDNAFTVKLKPIPAQFVHRWTFTDPAAAIESFDFTIARAAFWWTGTAWASCVDPHFYPDLAAKRLVYCSPVRIEEAGGSMLRVLKFYQRGYRIPLDSLGAVISRLVMAVDMNKVEAGCGGESKELRIAFVLTGLLREVDPAIDPDHIAHLPSLEEEV